MEFLGTALRWLQLTSCLVLFGSFSLLLLAGPGRSPDAARWRGAVFAAAPWLVALLLATAAGLLMLQAASVSGRGEAAFQWSEWARLLERTRYGAVWQVRQATALILLLLLLGRGPLIARFGERIVDVALLTLALLINAAVVFTGHGAATEPLLARRCRPCRASAGGGRLGWRPAGAGLRTSHGCERPGSAVPEDVLRRDAPLLGACDGLRCPDRCIRHPIAPGGPGSVRPISIL